MIVDREHKYVFISVPKTASISVQFSLGWGHDIPEPDLYHCSIADVLAKHPEAKDFFKFAFVRNPWARLVSLYFDFTKKRGNQYSAQVRHDQPLLSEFRDFEDLCLRLHESPWLSDVFFRSQTAQLSVDGALAMDHYGRFENLPAEFVAICGKIGIPAPPLQKWNEGVYERDSYRRFYPSQLAVNAVARLYADDIENFHYDF